PSELLFPCYVFVRCHMSDVIYMSVAAYEAVISILGRAWRIPSVLAQTEIENLKKILRAPKRPELVTRRNIGEEAEVTAGILKGVRGRIVETSATHVKLETGFSFLNAATGVIVAIPRCEVRLVELPCLEAACV